MLGSFKCRVFWHEIFVYTKIANMSGIIVVIGGTLDVNRVQLLKALAKLMKKFNAWIKTNYFVFGYP